MKNKARSVLISINSTELGPFMKAWGGGTGGVGGDRAQWKLAKDFAKKKKKEINKNSLDIGHLECDHLIQMRLQFTPKKGNDKKY